MTDKEIIEVLKPCVAELNVIRALLEDNGFEQVASKLLGTQANLGRVIDALKKENKS